MSSSDISGTPSAMTKIQSIAALSDHSVPAVVHRHAEQEANDGSDGPMANFQPVGGMPARWSAALR